MKSFMRAAIAAMFAVALALPALSAETIKGEVQKIDDAAGKITLKHGAAKSLGMDAPMTMVYRVKDPAMLKEIKAGDKVEFEAEEAASGVYGDEDSEGEVSAAGKQSLSAVISSEAKQSIVPQASMDCFVAEPVIGRAFARPVGSSQ